VLTIAGAGMAGLSAAVRARELGVDVVVLEKGTRPGGSMLLSSCVIWRFRTLADFRAECPGGDERLQATVLERLDDGLAWLESLGAPVVARETDNPRTVGVRFDPRGLTEALVRAAGDVRLGTPLPPRVDGAVILATGGFGVRLARERGLLVRSNPWSEGDALDWATARGAAAAGPLDEFYGRAMPAPPARIREEDFVPLAQLYGSRARVVNELGEPFFDGPPAWSENDLVQAIARQPGGRAWFEVEPEVLADPDVARRVEGARRAGGTVLDRDGRVAVHVAAAVTHTIGGLRIDERARVLDAQATPVPDLYAAGADVGGISTGGYASGLAAALVFGRIAAEEARNAGSG
jgi:succinate dehydrogenase/fumarate reductase flavoprotein subunit